MEKWRGKAFTEEELRGFDLETLIGISCRLVVEHSTDGKWANVTSVFKPEKGQKAIDAGEYIRHIERDPDRSKDVRSQQKRDMIEKDDPEEVEETLF